MSKTIMLSKKLVELLEQDEFKPGVTELMAGWDSYAYPLGIAIERPQLISAFIEDKNRHILPYVTFEGGSLTIAAEAINILNQL